MHPISLVARAACALVLAFAACLPARAATVDVPVPDAHPQVATTLKVTPLANGNLLIHDPAAFEGRGAVRLVRPDGTIVSTLRGRHPAGAFGSGLGDGLGLEVHALDNGHALVVSHWLTPEGVVGAVTWIDGENGLEGVVGEQHSMVGVLTGTAGFEKGSMESLVVRSIPGDRLLVGARYWNRGVGAVFVMAADRPTAGIVDATTAITGAHSQARLGAGIGLLDGDAFYLGGELRMPSGQLRRGVLVARASDLPVGPVTEDALAWGPVGADPTVGVGVKRLGPGEYALVYGTSRVGLRWCRVSAPCTGPMTDDNAILGDAWAWGFEVAGVLANGDYIVANYGLNNGAARSAGGVRLCRAGAPCTGPLTEVNALVGTRDFDRVGERVLMLSNGHAIVVSANWSGADRPKGGAFTWFDGGGSTVGAVSEANSLVGPAYSGIGGLSSSPSIPNGGSLGGSILELPDGDVLIASPIWTDDPAVLGKGAITRFSGNGPVTGEVGPANSIVGTRGDMLLGSGGFRLTADGHIIIVSPVARAADDGTERVGAITWWHRDAPTTGTIGPHNSLVGSSPGDFIGYGGVRPIGDGRVMVISPDWRNGTQRKAGAITIMPDDRPWSAVVSAANSIVGDQEFDRVGGSGFGLWRRVGEDYEEVAPDDLRPVRNGFAIVSSGYWRTDYTSVYDIHSIGAITAFLPGATPTGVLSESNSLVGETYGISPAALGFQPSGERMRLRWRAFAERVGGTVDVPMGELRGRFRTLTGDGVEGRANLSSRGFNVEHRPFELDGSMTMRHDGGGPFATPAASVFRADLPIRGLLPRNTVVATAPGQALALTWMPASSTLVVVRPADGLISLLRDNAVPVLGEDGAISGGPGVGDTFTLVPPSSSDEDGDAVSLAYQWRRGDAPIPGATALDYVATAEDAGARLSVEVTARDAHDRATRVVDGPRVAFDANRAPVFAREPVIGGRPRVAGRLRAYRLEATDPDGDPVVVRLQWRRDGVAIPGATAASYVVGFADADAVIDLVVEASDGLAATVAETNALPIDETSPVVEDDRFEARSGFPIQIPAPGIFANDANVFLPTVARTTDNGMLALDAQGGMSYMSSFDFVGDDVWLYRACARDFSPCGYAEIVIGVRPNEPAAPPPGTQVLVAERDYAALEVDLPLAAPVDDAIYEVVDLAQRWTAPLPARIEGGAYAIDLPSNPTTRALRWRVLLRAEGNGALRVVGEAGAARCSGALSDGVSTCGLEVTVPPRALSTRIVARIAEGEGVVLHQVQALDPVADILGSIVAHGPRAATDEARLRLVADLPGGFMPLGDGLGQPFTFTVVARDKRDGTELGRWPVWLHRGLALPSARPLSDRREVRLLVSDRFVAPTTGRNGMARFFVNNRGASRVVLEAPEGVIAMLQHRPLLPAAGRQAVPLFGAWSAENYLPSSPIPFVRGSDGLLRVTLPSFNTDLFAIDLSLPPGMGGTHEVRAWLELAAPVQFYGDQMPVAGQYFNPQRDGHGIFLEYGGTEAVAWWYAYDEDGRPAWYYAQAPRPEPRKPLRMRAYRATWTAAGGVHLVEVGELLLTRVGVGVNDLRLVAQYRLDGYTGEEELTRLGAGGCLAIGPSAQSIDAGGGWFAPALDGYGFSVQWERATGDEINVGFLYDGEGMPRWAIGQAPGTGAVTSSVPLVQYRGFPIAGEAVPLASQGVVGSLTRTIGVLPQDGRPGLSRTAVSVDWADGVPGGFAADQPMARLTDRKACFGGP